jgi:Xaa-Pro aminopeptidase
VGETIVIDIFPQHVAHGYWGDLTRTVVRGSASPVLRRMYQAVKSAQAAVLSRVRPGVSGRTLHRAAVRELSRRGFKTEEREGRSVGLVHSTGHGVGLSVHEAPGIGPRSGRLKRGNVVTIEPGLYYPDVGAVRIEDTILVTRRRRKVEGAGWTVEGQER